MKRFAYILTILMAGMLASCMHNGGDIGYLFGQWRLEQVERDGIVSECDTVFFAFQSDVFLIRKVMYDSYDYTVSKGLYEHIDNSLKLNIYNHNGIEILTKEIEEMALSDLATLHLDTVVPLFKVVDLDNRYMTLEYNDYYYKFKKLN